LEVGDKIIVIDGQPDHFWWKGQNLRTFQIGKFARYNIVYIKINFYGRAEKLKTKNL